MFSINNSIPTIAMLLVCCYVHTKRMISSSLKFHTSSDYFGGVLAINYAQKFLVASGGLLVQCLFTTFPKVENSFGLHAQDGGDQLSMGDSEEFRRALEFLGLAGRQSAVDPYSQPVARDLATVAHRVCTLCGGAGGPPGVD